MPAPRFGERIPGRTHMTIKANLRKQNGYPRKVWQLIANEIEAVLRATEPLSDLRNGEINLPPIAYTEQPHKMVSTVTFTSTMDMMDEAALRSQIESLLLECGAIWVEVTMTHLA